jgi:hypothetical protein
MLDRAAVVDFSTFSSHDAKQFLKDHRINLTLDEVFTINTHYSNAHPP